MPAVPVLTANSPSAGYIAWNEFHISYDGGAFDIPAGNTNMAYTAWLWNNGTPVLVYNNTAPTNSSTNSTPGTWAGASPTLGPDDLLLFLNQAGVPINVQSASLVEGDIIATGTITAAQIAGGTITGNKIAGQTIVAGNLAAGAVTAGTIAAGAVTAGKISGTAIDGMTISGATVVGGVYASSAASSGSRVRIDPSGTYGHMIQFWSGQVGETGPGVIYGGPTLFGDGLTFSSPSLSQTNGANQGQFALYAGSTQHPAGLLYSGCTIRTQVDLEVVGSVIDNASRKYTQSAVGAGTQRTQRAGTNSGTTDSTGSIVISHGLTDVNGTALTPSTAVATPEVGLQFCQVTGRNSSTMTVRFCNSSGAVPSGTAVTCDWYVNA